MKAVVEPLEGNKVKLSIEVDEQEFEKDIDAAYRKIAREVRVPGFRPGKAPRRILEARFGKEAGRAEALRDALPSYYSRAVRENDVDVVAAPEIDITAGHDQGRVAFDAVVEIRPQIHVAGYTGLRVVIPSPLVTDEEIDAQVDRLRSNFGELVEVSRPAVKGDHLTIDLHATRGGQPVSGLELSDYLYELGSGDLLEGVDDKLLGARLGDILSFDAEVPGQGKANLRVLVKDVKEKVLPEVTDEWASEASEFDTVEELRADIATRAGLVKRIQATLALRNGTMDALIELIPDDPPSTLIDAEVHRQLQDLGRRLEQQRGTIEQYLDATGQTGEQLIASLRQPAVAAVKADLALRAVAEAEGIDPTEEDIDTEIRRLAEAYKVKPAELQRRLERADQMPAVRSDWKKSKALEWLLEHVEIVDAEGHPIDRALLEPETATDTIEDSFGSAADESTADGQTEADQETDPHEDAEA
jgi:trigger factor